MMMRNMQLLNSLHTHDVMLGLTLIKRIIYVPNMKCLVHTIVGCQNDLCSLYHLEHKHNFRLLSF